MGLADIHRRAGMRGFVTTADVASARVASSSFSDHAGRIGWEPQFWRIWVPTGATLSHRELCAAAVASIGGPAAVTGASALFLDGVIAEAGNDAELVVPSARHVTKRPGVCVHRTTTFDDLRLHHRDGLSVAATPRALADLAAHTSVNALCQDIATAIRLRRTTLKALARELSTRQRFPGRANLRMAHGLLAGELVHSAGERLGRRLLRNAGFSAHNRPLVVAVQGRPVAEIDIPFVDVLYGVEIDGPHHLLPSVAAADRARDRILQSAGWTIDRFLWFEIEERPDYFVSEVRRRLERLAT